MVMDKPLLEYTIYGPVHQHHLLLLLAGNKKYTKLDKGRKLPNFYFMLVT